MVRKVKRNVNPEKIIIFSITAINALSVVLEYIISSIESNTFYGLTKLEKLNLMHNPIDKIDKNGFNNSNMKILFISIQNITNETIFNLINSLRPNKIRRFSHLEYYDSIYIENRVDSLKCANTILFMRFKLF